MSNAPIPWKHIRQVLQLFAPLWIGSAMLFGSLGGTYAMLRAERWSARQALVVRDQATGALDRLGRFQSRSELKAAQEMILEMAQNPEVVAAALEQLGPPPGAVPPGWPSRRLIDQVAGEQVNVTAPQGSQFGSTEMIYLVVEQNSPQRAEAFCRAVLDHLTEHLRQIRRVRSDSLIAELTHARDLAAKDLAAATERLHEMEVAFGSDLGELRNLTETISGDGTNRRSLQQTHDALQESEWELERLQRLQQALADGADDPQALLVRRDELLERHPALLRLKQGLVDAQLNRRQLASLYTEDHPRLRAARQTEQEIAEQIRQEAAAARRTIRSDIVLVQAHLEQLRRRERTLTDRLQRLARGRTEYAKADTEVRHRSEQLAAAERALSEAEASRSAALSTSLLSPLGSPQVDDEPVGPSPKLLAVGSTAAGLLFGLGAVFLVAPMPGGSGYGRRWSDYLQGRRASDRMAPAQTTSGPASSGHAIPRRRHGDPPAGDAPAPPR